MVDYSGATLQPQEVEVDQRALVNILSRYPGTFDVFRELIQNADDAESPIVEVHFETGERPQAQPMAEFNDLRKLSVCKWIIRNQGNFKERDWERLGKIAAGNDDSTKVGAFGVGFYSVLSKSDRPLVRSNGKSLHFLRGEDGKLRKWFVDCSTDGWTSVELALRVPELFPVFTDLTSFLLSSIALLTNVHTISVRLDGQRLLDIQKESRKSPVDIDIPSHLVRSTQSQSLMIESIRRTIQRITIDAAEWALASNSMPSSPVDTVDTVAELSRRAIAHFPASTLITESILQENAITHDLYTATVRVDLTRDEEMRRDVESSMKSLPSSFDCNAIYFNPKQHDFMTHLKNSRLPKARRLACLFSDSQGIFPEDRHVPFPVGLTYVDILSSGPSSGRLFIGQSTNQTTGIGLHISAHFLPTVERGSIDLANGQVAAWNKEVLWIGGFLARVIYEEEMRFATESKESATELGLRTMTRFAFDTTFPHSGVSQILQDAFFSCHVCDKSKSPFPVVSDVGISCASQAHFRQGNEELTFLKGYRMIHKDVVPRQLYQIIERYKIPRLKYQDILNEFKTGVTEDVMKSFFIWWERVKRNSHTPEAEDAGKKFCKQFASLSVVHSNNGDKIALRNIKHFTFFPLPVDLSPPDNIYIDITLGRPTKDAVECFGWTQLPLLHWLKYACTQAKKPPQNGDSDLGRRISRILVQFVLVEEPGPSDWDQVADLMKNIKCIPTNTGIKFPADSYFEEADICRNLPVVRVDDFLDIPGISVAGAGGFRPMHVSREHVQTVMAALGVRRVMEWRDMVERLETTASEESNDRLLFFLITHRGILTDQHLNDLKSKKVFYSQQHGQVSATEVYFPSEDMDMRKLGLPILALPRNGSIPALLMDAVGSSIAESFIIEFLGIQRYPPLNRIIRLAASNELEVRRSALQYLLSNLDTRYDAYKPDNFVNIAFIPTKDGPLARPNQVLSSSVWEKLGFKQVSKALRDRDVSRLGIKEGPSIDTIIDYLKIPESTLPDVETATNWFDHLSRHGNLPILKLREQFSTIPFVPVKSSIPSSSEQPRIEYIPPKDCFIRSSTTKEHHHSIFSFVDFGQNGNSFLESCCAKKSPDATDILQKIVQDPKRYLVALRNDTGLYREDLRTIALAFDSISDADKESMRNASMFLASRQHMDGSELLPAHKVVIDDWENRDFSSYVWLAPEDDVIEKLYRKTGSEFLGTYVQYDIRPSDPIDKCKLPFDRSQVIRRIKCFMRQRDKREKTDVSFYEEGSSESFEVRACKTLTMKKTFAPPYGVLADGADETIIATKPIQVNAGFESGESTLWVVEDSSESVDFRNDIAVALCRVLLKSFGPNDLLLLASLIAMDDKRLDGYYGTEKRSELSVVPAAKASESKKRSKVEFPVPIGLAKLVRIRPKTWVTHGRKTISPEDDLNNAVTSCGSDSVDHPPDFSAPCQPRPANFKKQSGHCKEAHKIRLVEKRNLQAEGIKFFLAQNARCQQPPQAVLQEFARLILDLGQVFGLKVANACYIFWKDTDEDLMAFNRDQKYIFFNLAHYHKFFYPRDTKDVAKEKKVITEWYLIMAHEIAHNVTLDHDEYHGSLSSRLAVSYLPTLHQRFKCFAGGV